MDDAKLHEVLTALLNEMRQSKIQISDVLAQRSEYAADIVELKASIDTTRRALDPEALAANVADNINEVMGQSVQAFAKGIRLNHDAATANLNAANKTSSAAQNIKDHADKLNLERSALSAIARHLEERDVRSKWDWVTLGAAMLVSAGLAAAGAYYYANATIKKDDFQRSIQLINQDIDATWCGFANGQNVQANNGSWFCAVGMPKYQEPVEDAAREGP